MVFMFLFKFYLESTESHSFSRYFVIITIIIIDFVNKDFHKCDNINFVLCIECR